MKTTPKENAIRNAYGEYYNEMKSFVNSDGWFDKNSFYNNSFSFNYETIDLLFDHKEDFMRPKSLANIENNNGWKRIDEVGLPKENCFIELYCESWEEQQQWTHHFMIGDDKYISDKKATHWKLIPITKPIY